MKYFFALALISLASSAMAQNLFIIKKNHNPKNILHFDAQVENCKLVSPVVKAYWVMGEKDGRIESLNSLERKHFSPRVIYQKETEADFTLAALNKMAGKMDDTKISIRLMKCQPKAFATVEGQEIQLSELYVDGKINLLQGGWVTHYMVLKGKNAAGSTVSIRLNP